MNLERLEALVWERLDGVISARDRAELEAFLAEDREARELDHELTVLANRLASAREIKPPQVLREMIDRALIMAEPPVAPGEPVAETPQPAPKKEIRPPVTHRHTRDGWPARLLPLAASLLIGVAIGLLVQYAAGPGVDASRAVGTMHVPDSRVPADAMTIDLAGDLGALSVWREGSTVAAELGLIADVEAELVFEPATGDLLLDSAAQTGSSASEVSVDGTKVVLSADGAGQYFLAFVTTDELAAVRLRVNSGGEVLAEQWFEQSGHEAAP